MQFVIYAIADPRDDAIFYVGHTSRFELRRASHLEGADTISGLRIRQIAAAGAEPVFVKLEDCAGKQAALMAEIFWIEMFRCRGAALANAQAYSEYEARADAKARMREALRFSERLEYVERIANGRPVREGRRWSKKEDAMVRRLQQEGKTVLQMADVVERSPGAIERRLQIGGWPKQR